MNLCAYACVCKYEFGPEVPNTTHVKNKSVIVH